MLSEAVGPAEAPPHEALAEQALLEAAAAQAEPPVPSSGFVVSITKRGKHRKLHAVVACPLVPDVHYRQWKDHGPTCPPATEFDSVCRRCMKTGVAPREEPEVSSSNSSSTSLGSESPKAEKAKASASDGASARRAVVHSH